MEMSMLELHIPYTVKMNIEFLTFVGNIEYSERVGSSCQCYLQSDHQLLGREVRVH